MENQNSLVIFTQASKMLVEATTIQKAKELKSLALTAADWAQRKGMGEQAIQHCRSYAYEAEKRLGELLRTTEKQKPGDYKRSHGATVQPTLKSQGITKSESSRAQKLAELPMETFEAVRDGKLERKRADRIMRDRRAEKDRLIKATKATEVSIKTLRIDLRQGDFRKVLADLKNVDAIITDPPYGKEFLPLLADLAKWADGALKPDGVLAVLMGQTHLPDVYRLLSGFRPYRWTCCLLTPGSGYVSHPRKIQSHWKPILIYGDGPRIDDTIRADTDHENAQGLHKWGQGYGGFHELVKRLTSPGETVADPFMGSGTTLLAAHNLGCHVIGCDIEEQSVKTAQERLA
jgi:hypothetical protein